jgi:hypothetical protein
MGNGVRPDQQLEGVHILRQRGSSLGHRSRAIPGSHPVYSFRDCRQRIRPRTCGRIKKDDFVIGISHRFAKTFYKELPN